MVVDKGVQTLLFKDEFFIGLDIPACRNKQLISEMILNIAVRYLLSFLLVFPSTLPKKGVIEKVF